MATIYKYAVRHGENRIEMPRGAVPTHFALQDGVPTVWCLVEPEHSSAVHTFWFVGTGHFIPAKVSELHPVGTIFDGSFVWHLLSLGDNE